MMKNIDFGVYSPSRGRANSCKTHIICPDVFYVVDKSEEKEYKKRHDRVIVVPDGVQGNKARTMNWVLDNCGKNVLLLDDDISRIGVWINNDERVFLSGDELMGFIENGFVMCSDIGIKFWGVNLLWDKRAYREFQPFKFVAYLGGPWQGHCDNDLRYDEVLDLKEDLDMSLQVLNKYRKVLRFQFAHFEADQGGSNGKMTGGFSYQRTIEEEKRKNFELEKKWGTKIVGMDNDKDVPNKSKQTKYDINPRLRIPIAGV